MQTALAEGTGDFVADVACELPLQAIAELLGIPQEDRGKIFHWSNQMIGYDDPEFEGDSNLAAAELVGYCMVMAEDRKQCPRDDIVTKLVNAKIDEHNLSADEFGYFMILLSVAGNETTRNAISHGMLAFLDNPEQWELYRAAAPGHRGRRDRPVGHPGDRVPADRDGRHRARRPADQGGRPGRAVLPVGQLRRGGVRPPGAVRHHAQPEPAAGVRRVRDRTTAWAPAWPGWRSS